MTKERAKINGFYLTLVFSAFHIIFLNGVIARYIQNAQEVSDIKDNFLANYLDISLVLVVILSWKLGRSFGIDFFIKKRQFFEIHYFILFKVVAIANTLMIVFYTIYELITLNDLDILDSLLLILFFALCMNSVICVLSTLIFKTFTSLLYKK